MKKLTITALLFSVATPLIARPLPSTIEPLAVHAIKEGLKRFLAALFRFQTAIRSK